MSHPALDRLTAWVHEFLDPEEAGAVEAHVINCAACRNVAEQLREEARAIEEVIAADPRLKERILSTSSAPARRGLLWQAPLAAALLLGLLAMLLPQGPRHQLVAGRVSLEGGRELAAPAELAGAASWELRALGRARLVLADRTAVDMREGSRVGIESGGERGTRVRLASGEAAFVVAREPRRLEVLAPAGRIESVEGSFKVRLVTKDEGGTAMNGLIVGALVTVLSGSASLTNERGEARVESGQAAVLARAEAPLLLAATQDVEALLKRLEQLAARVALLEAEVAGLESRNKKLKEQIKTNPQGGAVFSSGADGGVRLINGIVPGQAGASVILDVDVNKGK